jgi:DNA-binding NarL/FixJ family response regulator
MTSVLLAGDQALVRAGFRMILEAQEGIEIAGEADNGREALAQTRALRPDVVLMDIRMPVLDGIAATREIVGQGLTSRVLVLTTFDDEKIVYDAMKAGASGFLLKTAPPAKLADAVRTIAAGEALLAPTITRRMVEEYVRRPPPGGTAPGELDELTEREREVLSLIARRLSNAEIASELFVSDATVKTHVNNVLHKLSLRDRVQAVVLAYETRLVRPGERPPQAEQPTIGLR